MGLAVFARNSLAAVGHVVWMELNHGSSVPLVDGPTRFVGCIVGRRST
jgi:hypothetical protein